MQGRPKSGPEDKFRLNPVAPRLSELLGKPVSMTAPHDSISHTLHRQHSCMSPMYRIVIAGGH